MEKASLNNLTPELKASMDELREAARVDERSYSAHDPESQRRQANTIPSGGQGSKRSAEDVTPATAEHQASAPAHAPVPVADEQSASPADLQAENVRYGGGSHSSPHRVINRKHGRRRCSPLISHLIELRKRLLNSIIAILVIFPALVYFANDIYQLVSARLSVDASGATMIATDVASPFFTASISFILHSRLINCSIVLAFLFRHLLLISDIVHGYCHSRPHNR